MSLVIAFNLNDFAILATDRRGLLHYGNEEKNIILKIDDNYQKLRKIPFGFFASAGDYLIAECFYIECMAQTSHKRNLDQILEDTYYRYCNLKGVCHFSEMTTILLISKEFNQNGKTTKDAILEINIEFQHIKIQEVDSMNLVALMANMNPDQKFWDKIGGYLRSSKDFNNFESFFYYHLHLIKYIWQEQLKFDDLISHHIDFYFHDRKTSKGIFLQAEQFEKLPLEKSWIQ
ncbi:hypothetical protein [Acinetobacter sp. 161(2023)]|uniref:hypothetical protein n=1 Tax=Acinetobacter sp. 161(2023) TaxID=3098768 RepID=UPI0030093304